MAVKIAVIDTGVNYDMLKPDIAITENVALTIIEKDGQAYVKISEGKSYEIIKEVTHGANVINTINKYAGNTELEIRVYDIFCGKDKSSGVLIIEALREIMKNDVDIIVMSLTCDSEYESDFIRFRDSILSKGVIFLSSMANDKKQNCPSYLEFVYGVGELECCENGSYSFEPQREIQFLSNTECEFVGPLDKLQLFDGTSKATAVVAGKLAEYIENNGKKALFEYLQTPHMEPIIRRDEEIVISSYNKKMYNYVLNAFDLDPCELTDELFETPIPWNSHNKNYLIKLFDSKGCLDELLNLKYSEFKSLYHIIKTLEKILSRR